MKTVLFTLAVLLAAISIDAQSANVIPLSPDDSAAAMKAWLNLKDAEAKWGNVRSAIQVKYLVKDGGVCLQLHSACIAGTKDGFENGFEFSKDFKFVVPKAASATPTIYGNCVDYHYGGCTTTTPDTHIPQGDGCFTAGGKLLCVGH